MTIYARQTDDNKFTCTADLDKLLDDSMITDESTCSSLVSC